MGVPDRRIDKRSAKVFWLALVVFLFALADQGLCAQTAVAPKRVLVLYWDNKDFPGNARFDENFKAHLDLIAPGTEYYPEYMETTRFQGADQSFFHDYLRQKYASRNIDVIVASADIPLRFLIRYRSDLFSNVPIVFVAIDPPPSENIVTGAGMTGIIHQSTYRDTITLALGLHPGTNQLFVISGTPEHDKRLESVARTELASFENRIKITYLTDLPLQELTNRTATLPAQSIALYIWQQTPDERGKLLETYEVLARISPTASAPIYGMGSGNLGQGIVGGFLQGPDNNGTKMADFVGRILKGKRAKDIPVESAPTVVRFDSRQLKRWRISESNLPSGSLVEFKQRTFWEEDKWYIIGASSAILLEALLIAYLLVTLRRVQLGKRESTRLTGVAEASHRRLGEIVSNVPGIVWESMADPVTNKRQTTFISDHVQKMLGYTPEEWLAQPSGFGATIVHEDDRERVVQESEAVFANGQDGFSQFRWRTKDGRIIWIENYLSPIANGNGNVIGLRGVAIDISDRKQAEENARRTEEKDLAILSAIPDLMFLQTGDGVYIDHHCSNPKDLLVPANAFIGKSMHEVLPLELAETFSEVFQRAFETAETQVVEYELTLSGEPRWFEARIVASGENIVSVIRDITARTLAGAALKESELNYRSIFNAANDAIFVLDNKTGAILDVNERMCEMYGCTPEQCRKLWFSDLSSNEEPYTEKVAAALMEKAAAGNPQFFEWQAKKLDGELFWVECNLRHIWLRGAACLLFVVRDVTERKRAESQLTESHRQVTEILESIGDAFYSLDTDFRFTYVNRKTEELWAMRRQDLIGRDFLEVFPQAIGTYSHQECVRAIDQGTPINFEAVSPILNRWVDTSVYPTASGLSVYFRDVNERRQAVNALRESEARLRRAQEAARVGTWEWNIATGEAVWSEMIWELLGLEPGDGQATIERFVDFIHPEDRERAWRKSNQILEHGEDHADEFRIVRTDGEVLWLASKGRVIRSTDGRAARMIGVNIDITDQHRALDELRESQERFAKAFRANPQPMSLTLLATGEYLDVNDSFLQMSGFSRDQVIGKTSLELNIWGLPEARDLFVKELKERGSLVNRETRFHVRDGSIRTLLTSAETLEIDGKQCLLVASSDITERMLAQQALRESEARFRNMADTAPVMIWIADVNKHAIYFNQQWLEFTGRTMEQEIGGGWTSGIHPLDLDGSLKLFEAAFDSREPFRMEYRLRRADDTYRWVIDSGTPRLSTTGEFLGFIGSAVDITNRKESEAALIFAHEALENAYAEVNHLKAQLQEENIYLQEEIKLQQNFGEIVGSSDALKYVLFKIEQVAPTDSTVLITGETGTGKELVARAIHTASTRRDRPMVKVNCAALSASLIESELFGHEKGSFTGAMARKIGRFELADGATIFLDEIGELPLELQVKLLRIIQEGEFERLGSSKTVKVDVRIIAATNRNLREHVNKGLFREDLWYRLNVFPITVPPLRQRRDDIPMLTEHFANTFSRKLGKEINSVAPTTINALRNYTWPGNVRELANVIERAVITTHGPVLRVREQLHAGNGDSSNGDATQTIARTLEDVERDHIIRVLEERSWRIEGPHGAAHVLGMNPSTLRTRMGKLGINKSNQNAVGSNGS
jgi:PAS domain S-box-containing protein